MENGILHYAKTRHTTKGFGPTRRISDADMETIRDLLRFSPSSANMQPWYFLIAGTPEGKARVARAAERIYPPNVASIKNASHVVVFASRLEADKDYLMRVLAQEEKDGRFAANPELFKSQQHAGRTIFVNLHKHDLKDVQHWMDKQVYLNLGQFLLAVAVLGIDAAPMEGVETSVLDAEFGLREMGYSSLFVVPLGYADPKTDYNGQLPKSRFPREKIMVEV